MQVVAGIDIGGTNSVVGFVNKEGEILYEFTVSTKDYQKPEDFVQVISNKISTYCTDKDYSLEAIGIGAPNGNIYSGSIEFAPNLQWKGKVKLAEMFIRQTGVKTFLTNDANAAAIGEKMYGSAKKLNDFIVITLGTGLGSGFYSNGQLMYGHDGFAGELGHTIVVPEGRQCGCGRRGCLETYASATGLIKTYNVLMQNFKSGSVSEELTAKDLFNKAEMGDKIALRAFDETARMLAIGISNAIAITSPQAIILFGGLASAGDLLLKPLDTYLDKYLLEIFKGKVRILVSELMDRNAAILGASALAWNEIL